MSRVLLDTNALLWGLTDDGRLGSTARDLLDTAASVSYSSVSVLEVTIKTMLGKLSLPGDLLEGADSAGLIELTFTSRHARAITEFSELSHHDPFDRMLLAQADVERLVLLTADRALTRLRLPFVADARA